MLNRAEIIGRLGKDPEVRYLPSGEAVCNFSVATSEKWKDKSTGEMKEETTWHRVSAFERMAEVCGQYLRKGSLVYVEGKMTQRAYTDKSTGEQKHSYEIRMKDMKMLGGRDDGGQRQAAPAEGYPSQRDGDSQAPARERPATAPRPSSGFDDLDDEIPF